MSWWTFSDVFEEEGFPTSEFTGIYGLKTVHGIPKPGWYSVRFRRNFTLEDAIGAHACSLEASKRVTNGISLGCSLLLPVDTGNDVDTLKAWLPAACWRGQHPGSNKHNIARGFRKC
jgi:hypothetical protein